MRKILFYINTICRGGAERVMVNLADQFAMNGYDAVLVTSFCGNNEYKLSRRVKRISLEGDQIIQSRLLRNLTRISKLRKICKREKPDIVLSFMAEPNFRAMIATAGLDCKTIISVRNDPEREYEGKIAKVIAKYLLPFADGCVFQTEDAMKWFPKRLQKKSCIIVNAVNPVFFDVKRKPEKFLVVTTGRLTKQKNHASLINAFLDVVKSMPEAQLHIYGEGELRETLQKQIEQLNLNTKVLLKGQTDNIAKVLEKASLFVLPSLYEGMPNALMEAMAAGVPSISTDCPCGGPKMLINNGVNGVLIPVDNERDLAAAMIGLLSQQERLAGLGKSASEKALSFLPEKIFNEWKKYLEKIALV